MDTCGAARLVVPAVLVGVSVSSAVGSDLLGGLAAVATAAVLVVVQRARGRGSSCAIAQPSGSTDRAEAPHEPESAPT